MNLIGHNSRFGAGFCSYDLFVSYNGYFKPQKMKRDIFGTIYEEGILTMDNQICRGIVKTKSNGEKRIQKLMPLMKGVKRTKETEDEKMKSHMLNKLVNDKENFPIYVKSILRAGFYRIAYRFLCIAYIVFFFNMLRMHIQNYLFMAGLFVLGMLIIAMYVMLRKIRPL